jgi:hypothetical protein
MIPQERVNVAAETANDYMTPGNHRAFNDGFDCGVRFAEAEMKSVAIDFAKFTGSINKLISCWDSEEKVWRRYNNGAVEKLTDKQVFDIFMAERNNQ